MMQDSNAKRRAIVFDLDGTLIDSAPDIAVAINRVMVDLGHPPLSVDYVEGFIGDGSRAMLRRIFEDHGLSLGAAALDEQLSNYMGYYAEAPASHTRFFEHVRDDLETLHSAGVKLGVCTNKPHRLTALVLKELGISQFFSCALGADAKPVARRKPDANHLLAVIGGLNETVESTLYVGDTEVDRTTAHNAGVPFFLVSWGGGRFLETENDTRIERLADLLAFTTFGRNNMDVA